MVIKRAAEAAIERLVRQFPAVLLLGPRQCGKTTLVKRAVRGRYFDLEKPSDLQVFTGDIEYALSHIPGPVILDEAQALPAVFPVLRALIDADRSANGRFFLLGSVNPDLVKGISESLAGRVGILELTPFLLPEVAGHGKTTLHDLWLRGGFPDAFLAKGPDAWRTWQDNYVRTFIERDIARHGMKTSPVEIQRLMGMISSSHGGILNASAFGRSLGHSYHTIQHALDVIEGYFLIRRLPSYHANLRKRFVKAPKLYVRDPGLLHGLLGIQTEEHLLQSPVRGNSFEGFMIEQMAALESLNLSPAKLYYLRTHAGAEIDLVVDRGQDRVGYEFKCAVSTSPRDWANLAAAIDDDVISKGTVVYLGERSFAVSDSISVVSAASLLAGEERPR